MARRIGRPSPTLSTLNKSLSLSLCELLNVGDINSIKFKVLEDLHDPDYEVLWVRITPTRLPRSYSSIITGTVYHPPSADTKSMLEYLFKSLTEIEGQYPNCGLLLAGDFNRLDIKSLLRQFKMKQLVHLPTRKDQTLDLIITNLFQHY